MGLRLCTFADKGKEVGGGGGGGRVGYSGPLYDFSSPCIYKLITGSHFPLNSNDCLQINDIAALAPVVLMLFGKVEEDCGCQSKSEG